MRNYKYLLILSMISVSFLNIAMLFTYRLIEIGPFLMPGGIIVFPLTYIFADIIAEVYGYKNAKLLIWGNFICILIFNFSTKFLLMMPVSKLHYFSDAYSEIFSHSLVLIVGYSFGFAIGDFLNVFFISRLKILLRGQYFAIRSITSSVVGQCIFSVIASLMLYSADLNKAILLRQFLSTVFIKLVILALLAYPSVILVFILKKLENLEDSNNFFKFNPFATS